MYNVCYYNIMYVKYIIEYYNVKVG